MSTLIRRGRVAGLAAVAVAGALTLERLLLQRRRRHRQQDDQPDRLLDAQARLRRARRGLREDRPGQGRALLGVLRPERLAEQGRRRPGRRRDYVAFSVGGDMNRLVPQVRRQQLGQRLDQGHRRRLRRRHLRSPGQPEAHHRLGRPDQAWHRHRHRRPCVIRFGEVEHPRRLHPRHRRRAAPTDDAKAYLGEVLQEHGQQGRQRLGRRQDLPRRHRRRTDLLRERGHHRAAGRREAGLHRAEGVLPDRDPGRGHEERADRRRRTSCPTSRAPTARRSSRARAGGRWTPASSRPTSRAPTTRATRTRAWRS